MRASLFLGSSLLLIAATGPLARADVLSVPAPATGTSAVSLPARGDTQAAVLRQFGEPARRHPAVGGGTPAQPPITRWDYAGFSVFFERERVVDAVVPDAPAPLFHTDELERAAR